MINRYAAHCHYCAGKVPAAGGSLFKSAGAWRVAHLACQRGERVNTLVIGGKEYTRNARGICEDAPCCGCCTI